jgi:hypothetical protein
MKRTTTPSHFDVFRSLDSLSPLIIPNLLGDSYRGRVFKYEEKFCGAVLSQRLILHPTLINWRDGTPFLKGKI